MSKVMTPLEAVLHDCKNNMTADLAVKVLTLGILATNYLERKAKDSVNVDYDAQADNRKEGKDVDAQDIFLSHREKAKVSKTIKAITGVILFGEDVKAFEEKAKAIPADKVADVPALPALVKAK